MVKSTYTYPSYLPVDPDFTDVIAEQIAAKKSGKIFFFNLRGEVDEEAGMVLRMEDRPGEGVFIVLDNGKAVRIDRIITLFGKIGAAYDEYDAYGNSCMDCNGGYSREELNDM